MLICDTYSFGTLQLITEGKDGGKMVLKGKFGEAEVFNRNNRRYARPTLEREINNLQPQINERRLVGELDHPTKPIVSYQNASHLITELYMEGNEVMGTMELLNTPMGLIAQQLVRDGVKIGVSSRALGTLKPISEGKSEVGDDLKMVCWDIVADPSCVGAMPTLLENVQNDILSPYITQYSQLEKERIYIMALREAINKK